MLLADSDVERTATLDQRLREISDAVILRVPAGGTLLDAVAAQSPDVSEMMIASAYPAPQRPSS